MLDLSYGINPSNWLRVMILAYARWQTRGREDLDAGESRISCVTNHVTTTCSFSFAFQLFPIHQVKNEQGNTIPNK
jgi:hypothetical protein